MTAAYLVESYTYDESGNRIMETNSGGSNYYVYDASGNVLAIYSGSTLKEVPVYGSDRLGTYFTSGYYYVYELRDNVGSVRVTVTGTKNGSQASTNNYTDYFPYGAVSKTAGTNYRYEYQGLYSEKDQATGYNNFNLRMYDPNIGRWLTVDPAGQFASPYEGMGNNPVIEYGMRGDSGWVSINDGIPNHFAYSPDIYDQEDATAIYGSKASYIGETANVDLGNGTGFFGNSSGGHSYLLGAATVTSYADHGFLGISNWSGQDYSLMPTVEEDNEAAEQMLMIPLTEIGGEFIGPTVDIVGGWFKSTELVDQYALRATADGFYPVMERGFANPQELTRLEEGDVWKFGTTKNPLTRYSQTWLKKMGLAYNREFTGTLEQSLTLERMKIMNYIDQSGLLPAGNKMIK